MKRLIVLSLIGWLFIGCGADSQSKNNNSSQKKIANIGLNEVNLANGSSIPFPSNNGTTSTIFIIRPGEYETNNDRNSAALTVKGQAYSQSLNNLFSKTKIDFVLGIGNRYSNQTALPIAQTHGTEVLTYNNKDYGAFLDYVFKTKRGSKFVIVETHERIPELLRTLTPGKTFPVYPEGTYDKLYMVTATERTKAVVHELSF